jgi:diguanylate cyclase (GGDEF)-like protein
VLILTSHGEAASRFWGLRTGADAYLTKDHRPGQLVQTVNALLEKGEKAAGSPASAEDPGAPVVGPLEVLARVARQLDTRLLQATVVNTLLERGMAAADFHEAARSALETMGEVVDALFLAVAVAEPEAATIHISLQEPLRLEDVDRLRELLFQSLEVPPGTPMDFHVSGVRGDTKVDLERTVWLPLSVRDARGVLALMPRNPRQFAAVTCSLVDSLTGHLSLVLDNARLAQRLHELSTMDGLTRQLNHRAIYDRLTEELERAQRYNHPLSVILCDFDHFKEVNDSYGHLAGDAVLREGAALLRKCLRGTDLLGRYGGEEFLAVLPQVDLEAARLAAERLREELAEHVVSLPVHGDVRITGSFGVAARGELSGRVTGDLLVSLADRRLYEAKAAGRNCVRP